MNKSSDGARLRSNALLSRAMSCIGGAGFGGIVACQVYHLMVHPEWTEAESLLALWPFYGLSLCIGMFAFGWAWRASRYPKAA